MKQLMNPLHVVKRKKLYIFLLVILAFFMLYSLKDAHETGLLADGLTLCKAQSAQLADTELTGEQWREIVGDGSLFMTPRAELEQVTDVYPVEVILSSGEKRAIEVGIWQDKPVLLVGRQAYICEHGDVQRIRTPQV